VRIDFGSVYSTEHGKICPDCAKPLSSCVCKDSVVYESDGTVRVGRSTKGRKGKGVTTVEGLGLDVNALKKLAKELKQKCGTGGTVKNGVIEIQGEQRDLIVSELIKKGYIVKKSGS